MKPIPLYLTVNERTGEVCLNEVTLGYDIMAMCDKPWQAEARVIRELAKILTKRCGFSNEDYDGAYDG